MNQFDFLNTGNTGVTFGNEDTPEVLDAALQQERLEIAELLPSVQGMLATIDAEIAAVSDIRAYIKTLGVRPTKAQVEAEYAARELFISMCERMRINITNRLSDLERMQ